MTNGYRYPVDAPHPSVLYPQSAAWPPSPAPPSASSSGSSALPPAPAFPPRSTDAAATAAAPSKGKSKRPAPQVSAEEDAGEGEKKKRKRTGFACLACRKRRIKCDGAQPCAACGDDDAGDCCYPDAKVSVKYVQDLQARVRELEGAAAAHAAPAPAASAGAHRSSLSSSSSSDVSSRPPELARPAANQPSLRVSTVAGTWERTGHDGEAAEIVERAAAILVGRTGQAASPLAPPQSIPPSTSSLLFVEEAVAEEDGPVDLLDHVLVDGLLDWYLIRFQYIYPVLHWPGFHRRWKDGSFRDSSVHEATLNLVLAISSTLRSKKGDEQLAARYFARAQLNGTELLLTVNLDVLTYLLLLCFYSQSCAKNSLSSNAVAHTIFLSRSLISADLTALSPLERAMRRRCWAACRQMMATSSAIAFRAATTADDDSGFDEELQQIGGADDSEAVDGPLSGNPLLFFRETVKLFIIKTSILRRPSSPTALVEHETRMLDFWDGVPAPLKPTTAQGPSLSFTQQVQATVLRGRFLNTQILLHRPAVLEGIAANAPGHLRRTGVRTALLQSSAQECIATAIELIELCARSWFTLMHGSWWFAMGYAYASCLVIISYQISQRARAQSAGASGDTLAFDRQASAAVQSGLDILLGLSLLNSRPPKTDSRASPDVVAAAGRSHAVISRLQAALDAATPQVMLPPTGATPYQAPVSAHPIGAQATLADDSFLASPEWDDDFMDSLMQLLAPSRS